MNFYNTGNPVPSNDPRDLDDNAKNLDLALNSGESSFIDRKGVERKTISGYGESFSEFLSFQGWSTLGEYASGISIISHSQVVEYQGQPYALKSTVPASISSPYVTTGNWVTEGVNFKLVGDNSLRQDVSNPEGAGIIGFDPSISYPEGSVGAALKADAVVATANRESLINLSVSNDTIIFVRGKIVAGDNGAGFFRVVAGDVTTPDDGGVVWTAGGTSKRYKRIYDGGIDPGWFGAKYDRVTDDSAAVQACVDYCSSFQRWAPMLITGMACIDNSVYIDRKVDLTSSEFIVQGFGPAAGFLANKSVTFFNTRLPFTIDPTSEWVTFKDLQFESSSVAYGAYVLSKGFLRIKNINCNYRLLRYCTASIYMQSHYFISCNIRNNPAPFIGTNGCYDITFTHGVIENGNTFLYSVNSERGAVGVRISDSVIEGIQTTVVAGTGFYGFSYTKIHSEGNFSPELNFWAGSLRNRSITIAECYFINPLGPVTSFGPTDDATSIGNYTSGPFHGSVENVTNFTSIGDKSDGALSDAPTMSSMGGVKSNKPLTFSSGVGVTVNPTAFGEVVLQYTSPGQITFKGMDNNGIIRSGSINLT